MSIFYRLPAHLLVGGVSTDDAQDVLDVTIDGDLVLVSVFTPRRDDPAADAENRAGPETRIYSRDRLVDLAVYPDTAVDMSLHPEAVR